MSTCAECTDLLLDYVYGLLSDQEAGPLQEHLAACPACQLALTQAKRHQDLLARAALKCREVPAFLAPAGEASPLPDLASSAAAPSPSTPVFPVHSPGRWRRWLPLAAAASVVLAIGAVYGTYQHGLQTQFKAVSDARQAVESINAKLASLPAEFERESGGVASKLQAKFLHVQVLGPATLHPGVTTAYRVTTQTPAGQPAPGQVIVKLLDAKQVLSSQEYKTDGELRFVLPAMLTVEPGTALRLVVEATSGPAKEVVEQPLPVEQPTYLTHLALNKATYKVGDVLFFRTATLDRLSLKPVPRPVTLDYTLYRLSGGTLEQVRQLQSSTKAGGVAGGDFPLIDDLAQGDYLFAVDEAGGPNEKQSNIRRVTRFLRIEAPEQLKPIVAGKGKAKGMDKDKDVAPAAQTPWKVDFYPEGGDLVGGITNRVYYRLQLPQGINGDIAGVVEHGKQQELFKVKIEDKDLIWQRRLALGSFTFTPNFGETYRFRLTANGKQVDGDSYPIPPVLQSGVALTVPESVLPAGRPLQVEVRSSHRQPLLILASCRGRTVDQKVIEGAAASSTVTLEPEPACGGVFRVTVYQKDGDDWQPAAERLVYRQPAEYLKLSAAFKKAPAKGYKPGDTVNVTIEALDESAKLTPAWLFALVVDDSAVPPGKTHETSLPAYFLLHPGLRESQDLEDADFLLSDAAGAAKALDLFLGTSGWRRFAAQPANNASNLMVTRDKSPAGQLALLSAGTERTDLLARYTRAVQQEQDTLARDANRQRVDLETDRDRAAAVGSAAAASLAELEQRPNTWLRFGAGAAVAVLVVLGAALLFVGLIVALGKRRSPRLLLGTSFAATLLAVILFAGTGPLRTADDSDADQAGLKWLDPQTWPLPGNFFALHRGPNFGPKDAGKPSVTGQVYASAKSSQEEAAKNISKAFLQKGAELAALDFEYRNVRGNLKAPGGAGGGGGGGKGGGGKGGGGFGGDPGQAQAKALAQQGIGNETKMQQGGNQASNVYNAKNNFANNSLPAQATLRNYANNYLPTAPEPQWMLLWEPLLDAKEGSATVNFQVSGQTSTYRVVIYGHTPDGRLGAYHGKQ